MKFESFYPAMDEKSRLVNFIHVDLCDTINWTKNLISILLFNFFSSLQMRYIFHHFFADSFYIVHPCDKESKGGCEHVCNKKGTELLCTCNEGYKLKADEKSCEKSE